MKAFAYRDGRIKFGNSVAPGAILLCSGHAKTVHDAVHAVADRGRFDLVVPGVRDAISYQEATAALLAFAVKLAQRIERAKAKGVRRGT